MSRKSIFAFLMIFLLIPLLSGCWDSLDIEKRATILAIAIDKVDDGKKEEGYITHMPASPPKDEKLLKLTAQVSVPGRIPLGPETTGGEEQEPVWVLTAIGHTVDDALLNLQQELADDLFLGHLRIIVLNKDIAKEGVKQINDYFRRNSQVRRTTWMAVSEERAAKYMEIAPKLERVPALYLTDMVSNAEKLGKFPSGDMGIFWRTLSSKGQDAYLPYLKIHKQQNIAIRGLAYFNEDKMKGVIEPIETGQLMGVLGEKQGGYGVFINVPNSDDQVLVRAIRRYSRMKTSIKNGKPEIRVKIRYENEIDEDTKNTVNLGSVKLIKKIEKQTDKDTTVSLKKLIRKMQKEESDIFGFGEHIRAKHPAYWNKHIQTKEKWRQVFKDINVEIEVDTQIEQSGIKAK
ncbi:Ger(x)C family spore germination protein [Lederbergia sp. NSJ-179]|uniref:Ger(x)C family spore germination protein n=1 Tax=Lederbergia sp. NSJ-179 TaxID=2931402 RepID=UPI001FD5D342|nr:Ger(x)C family spore germination protein [Lederbergia sp. NSJ-179]MCJ7840064.1 Ger(x)C family spore germination protein [Lederbergia sp. NSJ-179]